MKIIDQCSNELIDSKLTRSQRARHSRLPFLFGVLALLVLILPSPSYATRKATRIFSTSLASDEILTAILEATCEPSPCAKALSRIVAVSRYADDPRYSNIAPVSRLINGRFSGDIEQIIRRNPDLVVLASYNRPELISSLKAIRTNTYVMEDLTTLPALTSVITEIGERIGEAAAAAKVVTQMQTDIQNLKQKSASLSQQHIGVLHLYDDGTVSGRGTMFDAIATAAGAMNVAHDLVNGWQRLSAEAVMKLAPGAIVVGATPGTTVDEEISKLKNISGVEKLRAWTERRILLIPDRELSTVSPHIVKAITKLQDALISLPSTGSSSQGLTPMNSNSSLSGPRLPTPASLPAKDRARSP